MAEAFSYEPLATRKYNYFRIHLFLARVFGLRNQLTAYGL